MSIMNEKGYLSRARFEALLEVLKQSGYTCIGPRQRDAAIVYDYITTEHDLPKGVCDIQSPGTYRLQETSSKRMFSWANGPQALKPMLFLSRETLWRAERRADGTLQFSGTETPAVPTAVIGVRACDLAALQLQDQHFLKGPYSDSHYAARRDSLFLVAVNCTHPAQTCFCASTGDGPEATQGFDLVLDELDDGFIVRAGSDAGASIVNQLPLTLVSKDQEDQAKAAVSTAAASQTRYLPSRNLRDILFADLEHERWENVAERCLSCGNCTSVCPTCFCHKQFDQPDLDGLSSDHYREWSSCFNSDHSYITGSTIRADNHTRYRQWLTHKLAGWHGQYGRSGCVGCGRCITWCPVGIDITEEVEAICDNR